MDFGRIIDAWDETVEGSGRVRQRPISESEKKLWMSFWTDGCSLFPGGEERGDAELLLWIPFGGLVVDDVCRCTGVGWTMIQSTRLGRRCWGVERDWE